MRTFHTGGIFTSEVSQQIISPLSGVVQFSKLLETLTLRTNSGEEVLVTKNSGSLLIIPDSITETVCKIKLSRNTIIFPKSNQYVQKDTVLGELININKQLRREVKPIVANTSGEIIIPKSNNTSNSKLLWILSGQLYNSPKNAYINFYSDYKINNNSYIFRTKLVNAYCGTIKYKNLQKNLYEQQIIIQNNLYCFFNTNFEHLRIRIGNSSSILNYNLLFI